MKMMVCRYCKQEIPAGAVICSYCRKSTSVFSAVGEGLTAVGCILTIAVTLPILALLFFARGC